MNLKLTPYQEGKAAYEAGKKLECCPYNFHTQLSDWNEWGNGWWDARDFKHQFIKV